MRFKAGEIAFLIESNHIVREVKVVNGSGGLYLVRFDNGGGTRVKEHRLFSTKEEATEALPYDVQKKLKLKIRSPYDYEH